MINEDEIKFNCEGLASTWFEMHAKDISPKSIFSLKLDNGDEIICEKNDIGKEIFSQIKNGYKGSLIFKIDSVEKEKFDII